MDLLEVSLVTDKSIGGVRGRLVGGVSDSEDVGQNAVVYMLKGCRSAWLAARSAKSDAFSRRNTIVERNKVDSPDRVSSAYRDSDDVLSNVIRSEFWEIVRSMRSDLAEVIELRYRFGYSLVEIASHLELSEDQVYRRARNGLLELRKMLNDWED